MSNDTLPADEKLLSQGKIDALREMAGTVAVKGPLLIQLLDEIDHYRKQSEPSGLRDAAENAVEAYVNRFGTDAGHHGPIDKEMSDLSLALKGIALETLSDRILKQQPCGLCLGTLWIGEDEPCPECSHPSNTGDKQNG